MKGEGHNRGKRLSNSSRGQSSGRTGRGSRVIYGWNPVLEALRAQRELECIWLSSEHHPHALEVRAAAEQAGIPVVVVDRKELHVRAGTHEHQGVVARGPAFSYVTVDDILVAAAEAGEPPFLLLLDHIEDPQNLGSLIRTAECAGVHGTLIPSRRAAQVTPAVGKASAGAIEHMRIARIGNLVQEIGRLKKEGVWVVGADMAGEVELFAADLSGPVAIVVGAEGKGLSRLVAERCDILVRIPMQGAVNSLNASVAGALLLYEVVRARSLTKSPFI